MLHRARELLVRQRTMVINALRGHCAELGLIVAQGASKVEELVAIIENPGDVRLPPLAREALGSVNGGAKLVHPGGAKLVHLTLCGTRCWGLVPVVHRRDPRCFE